MSADCVEIGGAPPLRLREPGFAGLAAIIVSQQVSVASARAIFGRLEAASDAAAAAETRGRRRRGTARLRSVGAEDARAARVGAGGRRDGLDLAALGAMDAADAHRALVAVKGIGPWTADIFLLFCLGHPDAFPAGDLALQEAARLALELKSGPTRGAGDDRRALAALARRRGADAVGLLPRRGQARSGMALADASGVELADTDLRSPSMTHDD